MNDGAAKPQAPPAQDGRRAGAPGRPCRRTGIVFDECFAAHRPGPGHPDGPERCRALAALLGEPALQHAFLAIPPAPVERKTLLQVHTEGYLRQIEETENHACTYLDPDTQTCPDSHRTALMAAGGLCRAVELVCTGALDNAMALVRPPGHHAGTSRAAGFCLFNNVAVGVRHAQGSLGVGRVLVVDWDLHHGNGTQQCLSGDPSVLFFSVHQSGAWPGSGAFRDTGRGPGRGYTINVPLSRGCGDAEYAGLLQRALVPLALEFAPELVLVSAGFDAHRNDPLGGMRVTERGFAAMTRILLDIAAACCGGKLVMALEGGYDTPSLRSSVRAVILELAGLRNTDPAAVAAGAGRPLAYALWQIRRVHGRRWRRLAEALDGGPAIGLAGRLQERLARLAAYLRH